MYLAQHCKHVLVCDANHVMAVSGRLAQLAKINKGSPHGRRRLAIVTENDEAAHGAFGIHRAQHLGFGEADPCESGI